MKRRAVAGLIWLLCAVVPATAHSQAAAPSGARLDFSSVAQFWRVVDILQRGDTPTEEQWRELRESTGYKLVLSNVPTVRQDITIAFSPARRAEFDSLTKLPTDRAARLRHIARALPLRDSLNALMVELSRSSPVEEGVRRAARFLIPGATDGVEPPMVAVAIFNNDGYADNNAAIVDLIYIHDNGLVDLLAHEFHHVYASRLSVLNNPPISAPDFMLMTALGALRTEGIADLIDKPYPLPVRSASLSPYVTRYRDVYERTPQILHAVDSLLVAIARDSSTTLAAGRSVRALLWSNAHPNGAFMARRIHETFGVDSLYRGTANPFAFIRTFAGAERKRGNPPPFSPEAVTVLDRLERKYLKQE